MSSRKIAALVAGTALALTACGATTEPGTGGAPAVTGPLTGVCPDTVVVQTDWYPEAEYGAYFQMLGADPQIDTGNQRVTAPLMDGDTPAGVNLEIRSGGPAIGYEQVSAQLYTDDSITLGLISTDEAVQNSVDQPTVAVLSPLEQSPLMIMWDRAANPAITSIADLGAAGTQVLYFQADTYMQYLLGAGLLREDQIDGSYDGSPARWVTADGAIAQGGFATSEPYIYANELGEGRSYDIGLQLISDTGYPIYPMALSVRADRLGELSPCLEQLVPMVQRAQVAFMEDPGPASAVIVDAVEAARTSVWTYSDGLAAFAHESMLERGIVGNGPDSTLGNMDPARVQETIGILTPIFAGQGVEIAPDVSPESITTNEFVDSSIGLP